MFIYLKNSLLIFLSILLISCGKGPGWFKPADVKDVPVNVDERIKKNIEEGRGIRFGKGSKKGGVFDFASSNELWRASVDILDFVPLVNASYSGGIIITDWFKGGDSSQDNRHLKITVKFLSNEIRIDSLKISVHERICKPDTNNCDTNLIESAVAEEIKLAILKKAAVLEKQSFTKGRAPKKIR
mgnify:CR=1 FL=1